MRAVSGLRRLYADNGFRLVRSRKHEIWACPCGHTQLVSSGSGQHGKGEKNAQLRMRRVLRECAEHQQQRRAS